MPLYSGKENIGRNIKTEETAGRPHKQAVAIALHVAGEGKKKPGVKKHSGKVGVKKKGY